MQLHWHTEPLLLLTLLGAGWLYALGIGPLRARIAPGAPFPAGRATCFILGLATVYVAVGSPIDSIGERFLFSVHMVQHMLLIYAAPILFFFGAPHWLLDLPLRAAPVRRTMGVLTHPACGGVLFVLLFTLWHVPALYEAGLRDKRMHILEHACMFFPAVLMLWPFLTPSRLVPRRSYPVRMVAIFLLMIAQTPVFAFLTFAGEVLYPTYQWAPRIVPIGPLDDQILGGIIMKVVNMGVSLAILGVCFYQWARSEEAETAWWDVTKTRL